MWAGVLIGSAGCYLLKVVGLSVPERFLAHPRLQRIASLLPVALLSSLVAVQTLGNGRALTVDARLAGVGVAAVAQWRRAPFLVVVGVATLTAAVLRLV